MVQTSWRICKHKVQHLWYRRSLAPLVIAKNISSSCKTHMLFILPSREIGKSAFLERAAELVNDQNCLILRCSFNLLVFGTIRSKILPSSQTQLLLAYRMDNLKHLQLLLLGPLLTLAEIIQIILLSDSQKSRQCCDFVSKTHCSAPHTNSGRRLEMLVSLEVRMFSPDATKSWRLQNTARAYHLGQQYFTLLPIIIIAILVIVEFEKKKPVKIDMKGLPSTPSIQYTAPLHGCVALELDSVQTRCLAKASFVSKTTSSFLFAPENKTLEDVDLKWLWKSTYRNSFASILYVIHRNL